MGSCVKLSAEIEIYTIRNTGIIVLPVNAFTAKQQFQGDSSFYTFNISKEVPILRDYKMNIKRGDIYYADLSP